MQNQGGFKIQVPPLDLLEYFSRLLLDEEEADVIFREFPNTQDCTCHTVPYV
jgi:hypothetical protein